MAGNRPSSKIAQVKNNNIDDAKASHASVQSERPFRKEIAVLVLTIGKMIVDTRAYQSIRGADFRISNCNRHRSNPGVLCRGYVRRFEICRERKELRVFRAWRQIDSVVGRTGFNHCG
jgi:hypothetical protein